MTDAHDPATARPSIQSTGHGSSGSTPPSAIGNLNWLKPVGDEANAETLAPGGGGAGVQAEPAEDLATSQYSPSADGLSGSAAADDLATTREFRPARESGRTLGRFLIKKELGAGAFGKVYLGRDPQLDRDVAIKVAKVGLWSNDEDRTRFLREARAAAQLRHPHIVPVYEFGEFSESDYIAYQYVKGTTLREELRTKKRLPIDRAVSLVIKIGDALHYAHSKKIIHRDVKPENILLDEEGEPHVADFGCARREDAGGLLTVEGQVMGTPAYMSPEQASGQAHLADGRSGVWSLGVMLEEMLTGQRPFTGTLTEILLGIRDHQPKPIRQHDEHLPKDLETIVQKCLAKRPDERLPSAGFLVEELQRYQRGEPILSRPIHVFARTWRWAQRNPTVALLLGGIVSTALLAAGLVSYFAYQSLQAEKGRELDRAMQVLDAEPQNVQVLLRGLAKTPYPHDVADRLQEIWDGDIGEPPQVPASFQKALSRTGLGLLAVAPSLQLDPDIRSTLLAQLLNAPLEEFLAIRDGLKEFSDPSQLTGLREPLWTIARDRTHESAGRLRAYAALAAYDPQSPNWNQAAEDLTDRVLAEPQLLLPRWLHALQPAREHLRPWLLARFERGSAMQQEVASAALASLFGDDEELLTQLVETARPEQLRPLVAACQQQKDSQALHFDRLLRPVEEPVPNADLPQAERRTIAFANASIASFARGDSATLVQGLREEKDPSLRTELLERLPLAGIDFSVFSQRARDLAARRPSTIPNDHELAGWILAMGGFGKNVVASDLQSIEADMQRLYQQHPDPGIHAAIAWAFRQWGVADRLPELQAAPAIADSEPPGPAAAWRVTSSGLTMIALGPVSEFTTGSPLAEQERFYLAGIDDVDQGERQQQLSIPRRFEIAAREVTEAEYQAFESDRLEQIRKAEEAARAAEQPERVASLQQTLTLLEQESQTRRDKWSVDPHAPARGFRWWDAISYCRWLSEREEIPSDQLCYPTILNTAMLIAMVQTEMEDVRLPEDLLHRNGYRLPTMVEWEYAARGLTETPWYWGLYATHQDRYCWSLRNAAEGPRAAELLKPNRFGLFDSSGNIAEWCQDWHEPEADREFRGGSYLDAMPEELRPARRNGQNPWHIFPHIGLRVARTIATEGTGHP